MSYPKIMVHPGYAPAQLSAAPAGASTSYVAGHELTQALGHHGSPTRFAPVTVYNPDQEGRHRAMGYFAQGENMSPPVVQFAEYPKMLSHPQHEDAVPPDTHSVRNPDNTVTHIPIPGKPERFPHKIANSPEEEEALIAQGYQSRPSQPQAYVSAKVGVVEPSNRQEWPQWIGGVLYETEAQYRAKTGDVRPADAVVALASDPRDAEIAALKAQMAELLARLDQPKKKPGPPKGYKRKAKEAEQPEA